MTDPTWQTAFCAAAETAINQALRYDPGSRYALAKLRGRVLAVEMNPPGLCFFVEPQEEGIRVTARHEGHEDTRLKGSPLALASLLKSERLNLADSGVEVFGSTGLLGELQHIIHNLDIDWEEALSQVTGDVMGHRGAETLRGIGSWIQGRQTTFERLLGQYLSEELATTPARAELDHYCRQVDQVRLATDRLEARIDALAARSAESSRHSPGKN